MSTTAPHTLMELSLLLSALMKYGVEVKSFQRISTELVQDESTITHPNDAARFAPELLQNLYLKVLKDEVRTAAQLAAQQTKRKRSPTPPLKSLDEAGKHKHLLPGLARRYYSKYVEQIAEEIAKDEQAYNELFKEIETLEMQPQHEEPAKTVTSLPQLEAEAPSIKPVNGTKSTASIATDSNVANLTATTQKDTSLEATDRITQAVFDVPPIGSPAARAQKSAPSPNAPATSTLIIPERPLVPVKSEQSESVLAAPTPDMDIDLLRSNSQGGASQPVQPSLLNSFGPLVGRTAAGKPPIIPNQSNTNLGSLQATPVAQPNRRPLPASFTPLPASFFKLNTPASSTNHRRQFVGLTPVDTSTSITKWKDYGRDQSREGKSPPRPGNSPYLSESPSPEPETRTQSRLQSAEASQDTPSRGRAGRGRGSTRGRGRGGRVAAVSPGLAANDTRIRSSSAVSNTEDSAVETASRSLKAEPPATPSVAEEAPSFLSTPGETRPGTRRRDQLRDGETPKPNLKRKRADTTEGTPDISLPHKFSRPGQILASRNFTRITSALLNDINSHKLASVFAKPITEKSAPGYQSLIYRPQDLKSIRGAISAGNRFIASIPQSNNQTQESVNGGDTPSASTIKATNIWVDRTAEVMPPKGIVNSAQLEKELARMLANAVMYNPDPKRGFGPAFRMSATGGYPVEGETDEEAYERHMDDGALVSDAREMFDSVDQAVSAWRAAERINSDEISLRGGGGGDGGKIEESEDVADTEDDAAEKSSRRRTRG